MNTYPALAQWNGTRMTLRGGSIMERVATNGIVRLRVLYATPKYDITVVHGFMSGTDRTTLLNFYAANRTEAFLFAPIEEGTPGSPRTCYFAAMPFQIEPMQEMPTLYQAQVFLREA